MIVYLRFIALTLILSSPLVIVTSTASELIDSKPRIVGGEVADEGDWPWMSALVYTGTEISTSLTVNNATYTTQAFNGGVAGEASGAIVDCGIGDAICVTANNAICLIERGDIDFSVKVNNCETGGGVGAIIYNNVAGNISGTLGVDFTGTIPVVAITQTDGETLIAQLGDNATLSVSLEQSITQSSTCGASFLGDKWLLTAAHCVDDVSTSFLKVNVGEYNLANGAEQAQAIQRIYVHPDYQRSRDLDRDIALIELVESIDNPAITLVSLEQTEQLAIDNSTATVIGWGGTTGYDSGEGPTTNFPEVLHQVDLQLITNESCKNTLAQSYTDSFDGFFTADDIGVTDSMICAEVVGGGKSACQGDSGGPLMVNTNEGWQQIGIVSWGVGCAAEGFPGVYTRAAVFSDWITAISQGIAIDQQLEFGIRAQQSEQTKQLSVINNSNLTANLSYRIAGSNNFTLDSNACTQLAANESCQLDITYLAATVGEHTASVIITADNTDIATSTSKLSAQTIELATDINNQFSNNDSLLTWYSGGDNKWQLDNIDSAIVSGTINNLQQSIVMATFAGEGELSFEWAVSSEENSDEPSEPYDALYVYLDNELIKFISGEIDYTAETIAVSQGEHTIAWVYAKDTFTSAGEDEALLRSVIFTPTPVVAPTPSTPAPTSTNTSTRSNSGGGALGWLLGLMGVLCLQRKFMSR